MMIRSFLCAAVVLSFAAIASADNIGFTVGLDYQKSYTASGGDTTALTTTRIAQSNGTYKTVVNLNGVGAIHEFKMYLTVNGMAPDQDAMYFQYAGDVTGGTTLSGGMRATYSPLNPVVDPDPMGGSDSDPTSTWHDNAYNAFTGTFWHWLMTTAQLGMGNTYGDVAAFVHPGEGGRYQIGTLRLTDATLPGTFRFTFSANPGYFEIISNNVDGAGTLANTSYPAYTAFGDQVQFVPEPGTLALLTTGLLGVLAFVWRKRK